MVPCLFSQSVVFYGFGVVPSGHNDGRQAYTTRRCSYEALGVEGHNPEVTLPVNQHNDQFTLSLARESAGLKKPEREFKSVGNEHLS